MKAAIYNPYLDTLGGGERYTMAVALLLLKKGFKVDVEWKKSSIKEKLEGRFGIGLSEVNFVKDVKRGDGYDVCFWVSDGSIPTLGARKNFLHFQVPFHDVNSKTLLNRMKLFRIEKIVCNSYFTKTFIDKEYGVNAIVIYPPIDIQKIKPKRKENVILYIGRFSQLAQAKRQDVLVKAFKKFYDSGYKDWELVVAGGVEVGTGEFVKKLRRASTGYPIEILESPTFKGVKDLYGKAKIFWSATGYGINEQKEPEKVEHFGISLVEAMAASTIPMVYGAGGHKEIVVEGQNGFLWSKPGQLLSLTKKLIKEKGLLRQISLKAREDSKKFSYEAFEEEFSRIISS